MWPEMDGSEYVLHDPGENARLFFYCVNARLCFYECGVHFTECLLCRQMYGGEDVLQDPEANARLFTFPECGIHFPECF